VRCHRGAEQLTRQGCWQADDALRGAAHALDIRLQEGVGNRKSAGMGEDLPSGDDLFGRCRKGVDSVSSGSSKLVAIDEQPNDQIVHAFRLGKTENWLRVLGTTETPHIDQGVRHPFHAVVSLLDALKPKEQPLEFVLPGKRPLHSIP
jgi:hypothetical protein